MSGPVRTISESWHRIAGQKISLRPAVTISRRLFRNEKWYVIQDPFNNTFFRISPGAYAFIARLRPDRTVDETWQECIRRDAENAPGQEDVIQLLAQLNSADLLYHEKPADGAKLFDRRVRRRKREIRAVLSNIMSVRIPLIDPNNALNRYMRFISLLVSPWGGFIWIVVALFAGKVIIDRFDALSAQAQGLLAPDNLIVLYASLVFVKSFHEMGHAITCKRFGGEVHAMGVMLLVFTPLPYMDATSSWSFRSRWHRALVGASGMIFELFTAFLAAFVWAYTGPGMINSIAYNVLFIASVSTVMFNAIPLLRYDGYYILSDLLDIPNLHVRAVMQLRYLAERFLFGCMDSASPAQNIREAAWLTLFGISSGLYRVIVYTAIILFVADRYLLIGLLMAIIGVISWGVVPLVRFGAYLTSSPRLSTARSRAAGTTILVFAAVLLVLGFIPFPSSFRAPGVLESSTFVRVVNDAPGYVKKIVAPSGTAVQAGTPLIELADEELDLDIRAAQAEHREQLSTLARAVTDAISDIGAVRNRIQLAEQKLANLEEQRRSLIIRAREAGTWVSPRISEMVGTWIPRGSEVGSIVNQSAYRFSAVVSQGEASRLFAGEIKKAEVRFFGQEDIALEVTGHTVIPFERVQLPSAALGWRAGGVVPVSPMDDSGTRTDEPFFLIYAELKKMPSVSLLHGRSGQIRFSLQPEPLLRQWIRKVRQLFQERYRI